MSHHAYTLTGTLSQAELPGQLRSAKDAAAFAHGALPERYVAHTEGRAPDAPVLMGRSRSYWFQASIAQCASHYDLPALRFLQADDSTPNFGISVHDAAQMRAIVAAIATLNVRALADAAEFSRCMWGSTPDEPILLHDIRIAAAETGIAVDPFCIAADLKTQQGRYDQGDGQGPFYFFGFLRTLQVVIEGGLARGESLVHVPLPT